MSADAATVLEVRNLRTYFPIRTGVIKAVDDVSFALERGRTLCIVGESGSGKSVTARSILQIVDPPGRIMGGQILLRGAGQAPAVDLAALHPKRRAIRQIRGRDIAMIFQEPMRSLSPVHRIGEQITESLRLHTGLDKAGARKRAIEILRRVEIPKPERAIDRYPFEYSGGMRQRAMIAMALACNPKILIADEPTTALDVTTQAEILDLMRELQTDFGMALMFITHDMGVVAEIADQVAVMQAGRIVEQGPVDAIFHQPRHDYTRMLLGSVLRLQRSAPAKASMAVRTATPLVEVRGLTKLFPERRGFFGRETPAVKAVDAVDLTVMAGEALGVVGESGSGKTTLGRCLVGIFPPTAGAIRYRSGNGTIVDLAAAERPALRGVHREIRMIFQDPFASLNPRMTVRQIVGEPLLVNGIARAIALEPRLIVADEATSALDVSLRAQVLDLLLRLQKELRLSFIFISHDISVVRYFCDRVAVMYQGRIVELGPTEQICTAPEHPYTKALISAVPKPNPRARTMGQRIRYTAATG